MTRNRSEGWTHAKVSGHNNEELARARLNSDAEFAHSLSRRLSKPAIQSVSVGGITESSVNCVLGGLTKSKTDLTVQWEDSTESRVSLKKSGSGQVFLIRTDRFIHGFESHYKPVPGKVQKALRLFFGDSNDIDSILESPEYASVVSEKVRNYEIRKHRLVAATLQAYDKSLCDSLLKWIQTNIGMIADFCFSRGLASDRANWAEHIWYINLLKENSFDYILPAEKLCRQCEKHSGNYTFYGSKGGGTTIQLPFGFLQWHQKSMQFHHVIGRIRKVMSQ